MTSRAKTHPSVVTVGYDDSATSRAAVIWAANEARARLATLRSVDARALITDELVEGTPGDAVRTVARPGDLIVVAASGEHAIPVVPDSCPVAVMPASVRKRKEVELVLNRKVTT